MWRGSERTHGGHGEKAEVGGGSIDVFLLPVVRLLNH